MTLNSDQIHDYLSLLKEQLLQQDNFKSITLTRSWASEAPNDAGVYIIKDNELIVYVGETGNLKGRMSDLLDSRNHVLRRTIGRTFYSGHIDYKIATANTKFPDSIEILINQHITNRFKISYMEVRLGRKELEELIQSTIPIEIGLNKRGKRIQR